jgi:hypothetical protein
LDYFEKTEHLDPDRCLRHIATLFTNNNNELLLREVHILGPVYIDKLDDVFTTHKAKSFISRMKNNKASGCDGLPTEVWQIFIIKDKGIQILMKLFNTSRNKRVFRKRMENCINKPIYKGKENRKELGNYRGISLLPVLDKIYS